MHRAGWWLQALIMLLAIGLLSYLIFLCISYVFLHLFLWIMGIALIGSESALPANAPAARR
jgi:hypothetical protein